MTPINTLLVAPPGVGKTAHVHATYDHVEVLLVSSMVEEDIAGLPYREGQIEMRTEPPLYARIRAADAAGKSTALFLDELDKGRRSVCDTLLTLITAPRGTGPLKLPESTAIVAAANTPEWGGGDGVGDAMLSRFAIVKFSPDVKKWADLTLARYGEGLANHLVRAVFDGTYPLIEVTGEEWHDKRVTCPRTIWYAMDALTGGMPSLAPREDLVRGLLTPNAADRLISMYRSTSHEVREVSDEILRSANKKDTHKPIRV